VAQPWRAPVKDIDAGIIVEGYVKVKGIKGQNYLNETKNL